MFGYCYLLLTLYSPNLKIHIMNDKKQNPRYWIDPIFGKPINRRGVPSYIRSKYKLPWKKEYLEYPRILLNDVEKKAFNDRFISYITDVLATFNSEEDKDNLLNMWALQCKFFKYSKLNCNDDYLKSFISNLKDLAINEENEYLQLKLF